MTEMSKVKEFNLDSVSLLWEQFVLRKRRLDEDTAWIAEFQKQIDKLSDGADRYLFNGAEVATYKRNGNLNRSKLNAEHPEVMERYTEIVAERKFNADRFREEDPELFEQYRAKVWRMSKTVGLDISQ